MKNYSRKSETGGLKAGKAFWRFPVMGCLTKVLSVKSTRRIDGLFTKIAEIQSERENIAKAFDQELKRTSERKILTLQDACVAKERSLKAQALSRKLSSLTKKEEFTEFCLKLEILREHQKSKTGQDYSQSLQSAEKRAQVFKVTRGRYGCDGSKPNYAVRLVG